MPTNTPIGTVSSGQVGTSAWANSVADLNTLMGMYDTDSPMSGSAPPTNAPNFQMIAGQRGVSFASGVGTLNFPTPFTNGCLIVLAQQADGGFPGAGAQSTCFVHSATAGSAVINLQVGGAKPSSNFTINYLAIGF